MTGSRGARPTGMNDPDDESRAEGLQGSGGLPGPLGIQATGPLDTTADEKKPAVTATELNLVGSYPKPATWTAAKEKELIGQDNWFPHTLDFLAVAGKGSKEITSPEDFLLKIVETTGQISRLNYFSHGVTGKIATSGKVDPAGQFCTLDSGWTSVIGGKRIADPYATRWGDEAQDSGTVTVTIGNKTFSLDDVRAKFAADAELWLFICHGGADPMLLQNIANTFQVKVKSFSKVIVYCAPANFPASRQHRVNMLTGATPKDACATAELDFHKLKSDSGATPRKP